jgi:hypothetical protein
MRYKVFVFTDDKILILKSEDKKMYISHRPYNKCSEIDITTYNELVYTRQTNGTIYPAFLPLRTLNEIREEFKEK